MGFNSRVPSVRKFDSAKDALIKAQRDFDRASSMPASSGEARTNKSDAEKALKSAQREYDRLRQDVIDEINEYDYVERMKNLTR